MEPKAKQAFASCNADTELNIDDLVTARDRDNLNFENFDHRIQYFLCTPNTTTVNRLAMQMGKKDKITPGIMTVR